MEKSIFFYYTLLISMMFFNIETTYKHSVRKDIITLCRISQSVHIITNQQNRFAIWAVFLTKNPKIEEQLWTAYLATSRLTKKDKASQTIFTRNPNRGLPS